MDLVTLAAVTALGISPKPIHAFVWHQSGGDPWSFSVPINRRTCSTMHDAFRAARTSDTDDGTIHLDLAGLRTGSSLATAPTVMPTSKMAIAVPQIAHSPSDARPCHALAPIGSSPRSPPIATRGNALAITFANAVIAPVGKNDAPNFDISNEKQHRGRPGRIRRRLLVHGAPPQSPQSFERSQARSVERIVSGKKTADRKHAVRRSRRQFACRSSAVLRRNNCDSLGDEEANREPVGARIIGA
jgi:hypothetical protein